MFIDRAKIIIKSGHGGNGVVSFHREKYVNAGGPDGGDGGKGGDIIFTIDPGETTLAPFRFKRKFAAQNGEDGRKNKMTGKSGENLIIKVPAGTLIKDAATGRVLADMVDLGVDTTVLKGGKGGKGNMHFATSTRQVPNFARSGEDGIELEVMLELKLLADVGLAGFPNVGKSTLLSVATSAKPEIADYHFTTVTPNLGVVYAQEERSFVMADIPGLIEGASSGAGLGHEFLRHIERTRLIIHVVDISGSEGRDAFEDFLKINNELEAYNPILASRPQLIAANKADMDDGSKLAEFTEKFNEWIEQNRERISESLEYGAWKIFPMSACIAYGTAELIAYAGSILQHIPNTVLETEVEEIAIHRAMDDLQPFTVRIEDGVYVVEGSWIKNVVESVNLNDDESSKYFQRIIRKKGLIDQLIKMGIKEEDTVRIYDLEFDFYN